MHAKGFRALLPAKHRLVTSNSGGTILEKTAGASRATVGRSERFEFGNAIASRADVARLEDTHCSLGD
jgi:hypothetical protein